MEGERIFEEDFFRDSSLGGWGGWLPGHLPSHPIERVSRHQGETRGVSSLWLGTWWTAVRSPPGKIRGGETRWPCLGGRAKPTGSLHIHSLLGQRTPMFPMDLLWAQGSYSGGGASGHMQQGH